LICSSAIGLAAGIFLAVIVTRLISAAKSKTFHEDLQRQIEGAEKEAENLIKAHKLHLASDRTSCSKATANQFRLLIHTAAYWLLHRLRELAPKTSIWRDAQFDSLRLAFVKIAARVTELVTRIKVSLPSSYPDKESLARFAGRALARPP
jgi:hypothetical protein